MKIKLKRGWAIAYPKIDEVVGMRDTLLAETSDDHNPAHSEDELFTCLAIIESNGSADRGAKDQAKQTAVTTWLTRQPKGVWFDDVLMMAGML